MKKSLKYSILYILFFVFIVVLLFQKVDYHMDELWSYGLANYDGSYVMEVENAKKYEPQEAFLNYLTVQPDQRFDYSKVWENQHDDNHPVLFYLLLHTIASFFPGKFSIWFVGVINLAFAMLLLLYLRKLLLLLTGNTVIRDLVSVAFIFSYGILNAMTFLRMYVMAMFWVMALSYVMLRYLNQQQGRETFSEKRELALWYNLFAIYGVTALSGVTHYYCIVFSVLLSVSAFVYLLMKRLWKGALLLLVTQVLAGGTALLIFPSILHHMFGHDRGTQSVNNLASTDGDMEHFKTFFNFFNEELFGGYVFLVIGMVLLPAVLYIAERKRKTADAPFVPWGYYIVLLFPAIVYFFLVGSSAPLIMNRYMYPIYPLVYVIAFSLLGQLAYYLFQNRKKLAAAVLACTLAFTVVTSYFTLPNRFFEYLYLEAPRYLNVAKDYSDYDCLIIYHYTYEIPNCFEECKNFKSVTFLWDGDLSPLDELEIADNEKLIVRIIDEREPYNVMDTVLEHYKQFTRAEELYTYWSGTTSVLT